MPRAAMGAALKKDAQSAFLEKSQNWLCGKSLRTAKRANGVFADYIDRMRDIKSNKEPEFTLAILSTYSIRPGVALVPKKRFPPAPYNTPKLLRGFSVAGPSHISPVRRKTLHY
jgi:hypothetical protein